MCHNLASEMNPESHDKERLPTRWWRWLKASPEKLTATLCEIAANTKKIAHEDPRRVIHSGKVGLALTLVSLFYYYRSLYYDSFGVSAMWPAVMTVVVVFEFSVGATVGKGLNKGLATLLAGALGVGAHHLASLSGRIGEPILLGSFVFLLAAASTFVRFFPNIKAGYDYGLLIFIATFSLISFSGFRDDEILVLVHKCLANVVIGGSACLIISILVCPVWAGEDLHNLIALNLEKLANFLEDASIVIGSNKFTGFGVEYLKTDDGTSTPDKSFLQEYKSVLNSESTEESLANFASWEPRHGQFHFRHPWQHYLKIGTLTRECAYRLDALSGYLNSEIHASPEIRSQIFQEASTKMTLDCSKALKESAYAVRTMRGPSSADPHVSNSKVAAKSLESLLGSGLWKDADHLSVIPAATVASLLIDIVNCTEKIVDSVRVLASLAHWDRVERSVFQEKSSVEQSERADHKPLPDIDCSHVVVTVPASAENGSPPPPLTNNSHRNFV